MLRPTTYYFILLREAHRARGFSCKTKSPAARDNGEINPNLGQEWHPVANYSFFPFFLSLHVFPFSPNVFPLFAFWHFVSPLFAWKRQILGGNTVLVSTQVFGQNIQQPFFSVLSKLLNCKLEMELTLQPWIWKLDIVLAHTKKPLLCCLGLCIQRLAFGPFRKKFSED